MCELYKPMWKTRPNSSLTCQLSFWTRIISNLHSIWFMEIVRVGAFRKTTIFWCNYIKKTGSNIIIDYGTRCLWCWHHKTKMPNNSIYSVLGDKFRMHSPLQRCVIPGMISHNCSKWINRFTVQSNHMPRKALRTKCF